MATYLTAEEMAAVLKVSPSTVRKWADDKKIPAIKFPSDDAERSNGRTEWRFDERLVIATLSTGHTDAWARTGTQGISKARAS